MVRHQVGICRYFLGVETHTFGVRRFVAEITCVLEEFVNV